MTQVGPGFASTFTTDNMENGDGEEDNVFEDNTGKEEEDLSDMQVYLLYWYLYICVSILR